MIFITCLCAFLIAFAFSFGRWIEQQNHLSDTIDAVDIDTESDNDNDNQENDKEVSLPQTYPLVLFKI